MKNTSLKMRAGKHV